MVLNHRPSLFEINVVIENHPPSIARAAALISQEKIIFSMVLHHASP